jgi:hypothetical protein
MAPGIGFNFINQRQAIHMFLIRNRIWIHIWIWIHGSLLGFLARSHSEFRIQRQI